MRMQIGIFTKTFARPSLAETLDAVAAHSIRCVQFDMACAGLPSMPDRIESAQSANIRRELSVRGITMAALSGTFNMIHPDIQQRREGMRRLRTLAGACRALGTDVITLSTGTRDPDNMWRAHPDNATPEAWRDLVAAMAEAAQIADEYQVTLAFEPEVNNVVDSAAKARRLLDTIDSPFLKVLIDGANVFHAGELPRMRAILEDAITLLGDDIALAHAKDLSSDGDAGHEAAGTGLLDYDWYIALLRAAGYGGPLILHSLAEQQVAGCVAFLQKKGARLGAAETE
jgi:sugar phosphate isomerase/epimerase